MSALMKVAMYNYDKKFYYENITYLPNTIATGDAVTSTAPAPLNTALASYIKIKPFNLVHFS